MRRTTPLCRLNPAALFAVSCALPAIALASDFRVVAQTGQLVPGLGAGFTYADLTLSPEFRVMNTDLVDFTASVQGPGVTSANDRIIVSESNGFARIVQRENELAPNPLPALTLESIIYEIAGPSGELFYRSGLFGPGVGSNNDVAYWRDVNGTQTLLLRDGQIAAGIVPEARYQGGHVIYRPNASGDILHRADIELDTNDVFEERQVLYFNDGGLSQIVARGGQQAPGLPAGVVFNEFNDDGSTRLEAHLDDLGRAVFFAKFPGQSIPFDQFNKGIWAQRDGQLTLIAHEQNVADNPVGGPIFAELSRLNVSPSGDRITFEAAYNDDANDPTQSTGVFTTQDNGATLERLAARSVQAPGADPGVTILLLDPLSINASGAFAYKTTLAGPGVFPSNSSALYTGTSEADTALLARGSDDAPGTETNTTFRQFRDPSINASGQVLFGATLQGPSVFGTNDFGIWLHTPGEGTELILREGQAFAEAGGRVIQSMSTPFHISDSGVFTVGVFFSDGEEAIVAVSTAGAACPGDCDGSGSVDFADLVAMIFAFPTDVAGPPCDITGNDGVNFNDLVAALFRFGPCE